MQNTQMSPSQRAFDLPIPADMHCSVQSRAGLWGLATCLQILFSLFHLHFSWSYWHVLVLAVPKMVSCVTVVFFVYPNFTNNITDQSADWMYQRSWEHLAIILWLISIYYVSFDLGTLRRVNICGWNYMYFVRVLSACIWKKIDKFKRRTLYYAYITCMSCSC